MLKCGTQVVGGVNARKAGTTVTHQDADGNDVELPVFGSVKEAMDETGADVSVAFVPPAFTKDACFEAIDAGIGLLVVITEGVPVQDTAEVWAYLEGKQTRMIGPNCPGIITPGEALAGITPATIAGTGPVGLVSKSGHADLPDDVRAAGLRLLDRHRHRRRPDRRHHPHRRPRGVRGRPRHEGDRDDRRDRRRRRGAGRRVHQGPRHQAGRRVRRRASPPPRARRWATPARSSPAPRAPPQAKKEALEAAGVKVGKTPSETARR